MESANRLPSAAQREILAGMVSPVGQTREVDDAPDVEGLEESKHALEDYPLDSLFIRTEPRSIQDVLRRIGQGVIVLDPDFQREFLWDERRQSRLIESVLMRIPLPVFYFAENTDGKLVVVDGLQRLTTFKRFKEGELALDLEKPELKGKRIAQLAPKLKNRFEDGPLTLYLIDAKVPDRVRLDIFERVNSGVSLTRQQMRNALYNGPATRLLKDLATSQPFVEVTGGILSRGENGKEMRDREVINRFFAYRLLGWKAYVENKDQDDFDDFLGKALARLNELPESQRAAHVEAFLASMRMNQKAFGKHAFRKHGRDDTRRKPLNIALFDVFSTGLSPYDERKVTPDLVAKLQEGSFRLAELPSFHSAISYATTSADSVRLRFTETEKMLAEVLGAP